MTIFRQHMNYVGTISELSNELIFSVFSRNVLSASCRKFRRTGFVVRFSEIFVGNFSEQSIFWRLILFSVWPRKSWRKVVRVLCRNLLMTNCSRNEARRFDGKSSQYLAAYMWRNLKQNRPLVLSEHFCIKVSMCGSEKKWGIHMSNRRKKFYSWE